MISCVKWLYQVITCDYNHLCIYKWQVNKGVNQACSSHHISTQLEQMSSLLSVEAGRTTKHLHMRKAQAKQANRQL